MDVMLRFQPVKAFPFAGAVITTLLLANSAYAANLINDGGFELPVVGPGGFETGNQVFTVGQTIDSAWTVIGSSAGNVAVTPSGETDIGGITYLAEEGSQFIDLTGRLDRGAAIGVQQSFSTISGQQYTLSFYLGDLNNPAYSPHNGTASALVQLNGVLFQTATNSESTGVTPGWEQFSYDFVAMGPTTSLSFISNSVNGVALNGLDNVVVDSVSPEPATYGFLTLGLGILALLSKRRLS